jgi:hypothetical protein
VAVIARSPRARRQALAGHRRHHDRRYPLAGLRPSGDPPGDQSVLARVWAAVAYALLPVGMGAVAVSRSGSAVVFTLIPSSRCWPPDLHRGPAPGRRAAWATGLVVAIAAAFVPVIRVVAVLAAARGSGLPPMGGHAAQLGITAVVPPVLLLPWTLDVAARPSLLFLGPGTGARAGHSGPAAGHCCCPRAARACHRSG